MDATYLPESYLDGSKGYLGAEAEIEISDTLHSDAQPLHDLVRHAHIPSEVELFQTVERGQPL